MLVFMKLTRLQAEGEKAGTIVRINPARVLSYEPAVTLAGEVVGTVVQMNIPDDFVAVRETAEQIDAMLSGMGAQMLIAQEGAAQ